MVGFHSCSYIAKMKEFCGYNQSSKSIYSELIKDRLDYFALAKPIQLRHSLFSLGETKCHVVERIMWQGMKGSF